MHAETDRGDFLSTESFAEFEETCKLLSGAVSLCIFWGPAVGGRVVTYRTAVMFEIGCQLVGNIAFGPQHLTPYAGVLKPGTSVNNSPELVVYALLCVAFVLPIWHLVAYWQRVPLSPFTNLGNCNLASLQSSC